MFLNPPDHTRLKRAVTPAFSPNAVEEIRQTIEEIVDYLLAKVEQKGEMANPNELDFTRRNRHIAFGAGIHHCLGIFLAKIEAQIAISSIIQNLPNLGINTNKLEWHESITLRGLKTLPVKFTKVTR